MSLTLGHAMLRVTKSALRNLAPVARSLTMAAFESVSWW